MHFALSPLIPETHEGLGERIELLGELTGQQAYIEGRMMINNERIASWDAKLV
jgi:hypothetical protein